MPSNELAIMIERAIESERIVPLSVRVREVDSMKEIIDYVDEDGIFF